ncbi:hypothetical protein B296_00045421, partial [Ensete ventricosum]
GRSGPEMEESRSKGGNFFCKGFFCEGFISPVTVDISRYRYGWYHYQRRWYYHRKLPGK